jgi:hypothetical protein
MIFNKKVEKDPQPLPNSLKDYIGQLKEIGITYNSEKIEEDINGILKLFFGNQEKEKEKKIREIKENYAFWITKYTKTIKQINKFRE